MIKHQEIKKNDIVKVVYTDATYISDLALLHKDNLIPDLVVSFGIVTQITDSAICIATEWITTQNISLSKKDFDVRPLFQILIPKKSIIEVHKLKDELESTRKFEKIKVNVSNKISILKSKIKRTFHHGEDVVIDWNDVKLFNETEKKDQTKAYTSKSKNRARTVHSPTWMQVRGMFEGIAGNFIYISHPDNINMDKLIQHPKTKPVLFCIPIELVLHISKDKSRLITSEYKPALDLHAFPKSITTTRYGIEKIKGLSHGLFSWIESDGEHHHTYGFILEENSSSIKIASTSNISGFTEIKLIKKNALIK